MGDTTNFQLYIHSTTEADAGAFADFIADHGLGLNWSTNYGYDRPTDLSIGECYGDTDASTGRYQDAEGLADDVPDSVFVAWTDPKYEFLGSIVIHVPGMGMFTADCDANGQVVLNHNTLTFLLDRQPDTMTVAEFREVLGRETGKPWFDAIAVLGEQPATVTVPPRPDDEGD